MKDYEVWDIAGHTLEFIDDTHTYLCDGVIIPSITQILKTKFGGKYEGIKKETLNNASKLGTAVHEAIERMCKEGIEAELPEIRNFKFLQKQYGFTVLENEIPVILSAVNGSYMTPICAGRLDMVIDMDGKTGLADIKRTSELDKDYLAYQLNLYRIAYRQSYGIEAEFLRGIHLRENTRKFVTIPVNEDMAWDLVDEFLREEKHE